MNPEERPAFARLLAVLGETFNEPVSQVRARAYFEALSDLPYAVVEQAARRATETLKWFPKPVELRELAIGKAEDAAEEAWTRLVEEARRTGAYGTPSLPPAMDRAMRAVFGSWRDFCSAEVRGPEGLGWRKQFLAAYEACARRELAGVPERALTQAEAQAALQDVFARRLKALPE